MPAPTALTGFAHQWNFNAATLEFATGGSEVSGVTIARGDTINAYVPIAETVPTPAYRNGLVFEAAKYAVIHGTGTNRGMAAYGWTGTAEYPTAGTVSRSMCIISHYTGDTPTTFDPQNCAFIIVFKYSIRGNTSDEDVVLLDLNAKLVIKIDKTTHAIKVDSSGGGGGTSLRYAHNGTNILYVSSSATEVKVRTITQPTVNTLPDEILGTTASAILIFGSKLTTGANRFCGKWQRVYAYTSASNSDADVLSAMQTVATEFGVQTKRHMVVFLGTSHMNGFFDVPGMSVPERVAEAHPDWLVMSFAKESANFDPEILAQIDSLVACVAGMAPVGGKVVVYIEGGTNENLGGGTTTGTANTNLGTCLTGIETGLDSEAITNYKIVAGTCRPLAQIGASDVTVAATEVWNRAFAGLVRARLGVTIDAVVDRQATYDTGAGTAAACRTLVTADPSGINRSFLPAAPTGTFGDGTYVVDLVAATAALGADGIHDGILGQEQYASAVSTKIGALLGGGGRPPQLQAVAAMRAMGAIP